MKTNLKRLTLLIFILVGVVPMVITYLLIQGWESSLLSNIKSIQDQNRNVVKNSVVHHLEKLEIETSSIVKGSELKEFFRTPDGYKAYLEALIHGYLNQIKTEIPEVESWFLFDSKKKKILQSSSDALAIKPKAGFYQSQYSIFYTKEVRLNEQDFVDSDGELLGFLVLSIPTHRLLKLHSALKNIALEKGAFNTQKVHIDLKDNNPFHDFNYRYYFAFIVLGLVTSLILGGLFLYFSLFRPLRELTKRVVVDGSLETRGYANKNEIEFLANAFDEYNVKIQEKIKVEAVLNVSKKVAHDIKSPLTSMEYFFDNIKGDLDEPIRNLGRLSLQRIQDIINTLNSSAKNNHGGESSKENVGYLLASIVSEKRNELCKRKDVALVLNIPSEAQAAFLKINKTGFFRSFSNLINNSLEAKPEVGEAKIDINIKVDESDCFLSLVDNGRGMSPNDLERAFEMGFTKGKDGGTGIGLWQVKEFVEANGGKVKISSNLGSGTEVLITFPICEPPKWFKSSIRLSGATEVAVLDDDESIHSLWEERFSEKGINLKHFYHTKDFNSWLSSLENGSNYFCLIDYELLSEPLNGVDIISTNSIQNKSILVTSHFSDLELQKHCNNLEITMLPKGLVSFVDLVLDE